MEHSEFRINLVKESLISKVAEKTPRKYGGDMIRAAEVIDLLLKKVDALKNGTEGPDIPESEIHFLKERLIDKAFRDRTPKKYAASMYEATEIISQLMGEIDQLKKAKEKENTRICLNCDHIENMDYIRGCGICAALEGETVILSDPCICPKDILADVEALLVSAKRRKVPMRDMNKEIRNELIADIQLILTHSVGAEYCQIILDSHEGVGGSTSSILADIVQNVMECSAWEDAGYYAEDDVRFAIGRVLMERIGIEY